MLNVKTIELDSLQHLYIYHVQSAGTDVHWFVDCNGPLVSSYQDYDYFVRCRFGLQAKGLRITRF